MITTEQKEIIDSMSYSQLLRKWRFAPAGDEFFIGEVGDYYQKVMDEKRQIIGVTAAVRASKEIGWEH